MGKIEGLKCHGFGFQSQPALASHQVYGSFQQIRGPQFIPTVTLILTFTLGLKLLLLLLLLRGLSLAFVTNAALKALLLC